MTQDAVLALMQNHGLWLVGPMAVVEGPIVTVIAAYLAKLGYMTLWGVYLVCVLGDLIGDGMYYWIGRAGPAILPHRWLAKLGLNEARQLALEGHFAKSGPRTLLIAKWSHSAGLPIMLAAGAAQMNFPRYMWWNLLGTIPKTAAFTAIGWFIGSAYSAIDTWIWRVSLAAIIMVVSVVFILWRRKRA